jgi:hypothetical protein
MIQYLHLSHPFHDAPTHVCSPAILPSFTVELISAPREFSTTAALASLCRSITNLQISIHFFLQEVCQLLLLPGAAFSIEIIPLFQLVHDSALCGKARSNL